MHDRSKTDPVIVSARHFTAQPHGLESSYRMIRLLGRGTMASVYLAEQISMARPVALKILSPALAADKEFVERFLREARASARLNHPNIVTAIDFGEIDNRFFLAMEFIDGENLSTILAREGPVEESRVIGIGLQVISALHHAAQHHVIHLDVKPANIMICKDGRVKLADFGLAMVLDSPGMAEASRKAVGTPYYMAPEQVEGGKLDWRTDQYSLGASLYEAVTGIKPFRGNSVSDILVKRFFEKPEPAWKIGKRKVTRAFSAILSKMMTRSPDGRYQSFEDLEKDFNLVKDGGKPLTAKISQSSVSMPSASSWQHLGDTTVIGRVDSVTWKRHKNWLIFAMIAFAMVMCVYGILNAKVLMGPQLPPVVREEMVAAAENVVPSDYRGARRQWQDAVQKLLAAEISGKREDAEAALASFRHLAESRNMQDSVYFPPAKLTIAQLERQLEEFD